MIRLGSQGLYVSMFDEFNEGNQIAKTAVSAAWVPAGTGIRALDEDGTACSADYYLRITADGGRMLKGRLPLTATRPTPPLPGSPPPPAGDLALRRPATAGSHTQAYAAANAVDGNPATYWESANHAFPQWLQVDLGAATTVSRVVLKLPPGWERRTQTVRIEGGPDGGSFTTLAAAAGRTFDPASGNEATITFAPATARHLRVTVTANTGWPAGQVAALEAYANP